MAIETNSPARIADPTITDVRSFNSIFYTDLHAKDVVVVFPPSPLLPIILPILQAASIATKVGAKPSATSVNELIKSTMLGSIR